MANIVAPYRVPIYRTLAQHFDVRILISGEEDNRTWDQSGTELELDVQSVSGLTLRREVKKAGGTFDLRYFHLSPGYLPALIRWNPSAVITTEMGFRSAVALLYCGLLRRPLWIWWGGTPHTEAARGWIRRLWRSVLARIVPRWISYGKSSTTYLRKIGVPKNRILQIQNAVDESIFLGESQPQADPLARVSGPDPRMLVVGQLIQRKGLLQVVNVVTRLQREGMEFSTILVGDGPEEHWLKQEIRTRNLENVWLISSRAAHEMPAIYKAADWLVFPTLEDVWGLVVNEALWSGLPVIASRHAGCAEELLPNRCIFDPLDENDFVDVFRSAVRGELELPGTDRLIPCETVGTMIVEDILRHVDEASGDG